MILVIDNGSAYIKQLCNAIDGEYYLRHYNDVNLNGCNCVILSGRIKNDKNMNVKNIEIVRWCYANGIPLLGICYGAEIIALALGGTIKRLNERVHGFNQIIVDKNQLIDKDKMTVFESHNYIIAKPPAGFRSIAYSNNSKNEIIINDMIIGVQFHPELSDDGRKLISNFINISKRKSIIP